MGSPASSCGDQRRDEVNGDIRAFDIPAIVTFTYLTSVNPSAFRRSVTMNCGATQTLGCWAILNVVVSGGGSPEACPGGQPSSPTFPATLRKRSRLVIIV
jgi:hypothetical protein